MTPPPAYYLKAVTMAAFFKIRYLHLHLTDDHSWTWPSEAFPLLGTNNIGFRGEQPPVYCLLFLRTLKE